jgi:Putative inner membrane protein (DUF1819)
VATAIAPHAAIYTSRIQKAAGALRETRLLLAGWDSFETVQANLSRLESSGVLGKRSATRTHDLVFRVFKGRYTSDPDVVAALSDFVKNGLAASSLDPILYLLTAQSDPLLHDAAIELICPQVEAGQVRITVRVVEDWLNEQVSAGLVDREWSATTTTRVARGLLAALRDFGVLSGKAKKEIAPMYLPTDAFAFIAYLLHRQTPAAGRLLRSPEWRLFFLSFEAVERFFLEAHQERLLQFNAAGNVVRIDFPAHSAREYARVVLDRRT